MPSKSVCETVVLQNGVGLYGGYDAANGWSRSASNLTIISSFSPSILAADLKAATEVQLVTVQTSNAVSPFLVDERLTTTPSADLLLMRFALQPGGA